MTTTPTTTLIAVDAEGRLTLPDAVRRLLGIGVARSFELELEATEDAITLRLAEAIPEEDAWAYTPEHLGRVERARREGGGAQLSEADLLRLIGE